MAENPIEKSTNLLTIVSGDTCLDKGIWTNGVVVANIPMTSNSTLGQCIDQCNLEPTCLFANYKEFESGGRWCDLLSTNDTRNTVAGSATYFKMAVPPPVDSATLRSELEKH